MYIYIYPLHSLLPAFLFRTARTWNNPLKTRKELLLLEAEEEMDEQMEDMEV